MAHFSPDGERLFFGYATLHVYDLVSGQINALAAPAVPANDAIGYIAVKPARLEEIAFATLERNIYFSRDSGQSWKQIAQNGKGKSGQ